MTFPRSLTTTPFERSSTGRFEACSCKPASGGLLPSSVQHHKLSPVFVTHFHQPASSCRPDACACETSFQQRHQLDDPAMHRRMIDANVALSHHFLQITKTQRVANVPSHTQQNHFKRIVQALQNLGNARSKRRSWRQCLLHREAKAFSSASNFTSFALIRQ